MALAAPLILSLAEHWDLPKMKKLICFTVPIGFGVDEPEGIPRQLSSIRSVPALLYSSQPPLACPNQLRIMNNESGVECNE
jgi:hypothetical protein